MKTTAALGTATRTMGKLFFALLLLLVAIAVGFGGTALFVYHQFGDARRPVAQSARSALVEHRLVARPVQDVAGEGSTSTRRVAALPSDQAHYTYADNDGGQPTAPAKHMRQATAVPAPLDPSSQAGSTDDSVRLNDPESHYIVDSRTGRVIGIDGTVGALRESVQEQPQTTDLPPRTFAVQIPPPEVRVASPVLEDGQPIYRGTTASIVNTTGSQYLPVRKALPVTSDDSTVVRHVFNAGEYMLNDTDRPVLRAQPVVPAGARVVKTVRTYRLPDGSQTVAAD